MIKQISPRELAIKRENGHQVYLVDVRQPWENEIASLAESFLMPLNELPAHLTKLSWEKDASIVVYCHHGIRSLSGARFFAHFGFTDVSSLAGGIDAWSQEVDPEIPRY